MKRKSNVKTEITKGPISLPELIEKIRKTQTEEHETLSRYHRLWYQSGFTWTLSDFLGVPLMKNPNDLWVYQELIVRFRPRTIIETGTWMGGSALWFAVLMNAAGIDGRIYTVDIEEHRKISHPMITFIKGDSTSKRVMNPIVKQIQRPLLVCLDAEHTEEHVRAELDILAPAVQVGEWLVVEDTNISWDADRGARGGVESYLQAHKMEFRQDILCERFLLTMNPGGWLQRVKECTHGKA